MAAAPPRGGAGGMICGRCDKPILAGQAYENRDIPSPSSAGITVYFHKPLCKKTPFQATQQLRRH
jgi:hypothetical protein